MFTANDIVLVIVAIVLVSLVAATIEAWQADRKCRRE